MENKKSTDSWNGLLGANFLKADDVKDSETPFVVTKVGFDDDGERIRLEVESGEQSWTYDLNVTNSNFVESAGVESPKALVGKKLYFKKVNVISPSTKKEVESLRIIKVE
jgi:hypothetical protein